MALKLTVTQLNTYLKAALDADERLRGLFVSGEISNFTRHFSSGHLYFTLKEGSCTIKCVMFSFEAKKLKFQPENGAAVVVRGRVALYERDGACQLYVSDIVPDGAGLNRAALEALYQKLQAEGLFDAQRKKPLPAFPRRVAVLTSASGAAIRDVTAVWKRRWPVAELVLMPVSVQGAEAANGIVQTLSGLNAADFDAVIITRGGGSSEDLAVFNDEALTRAVAACRIASVSAVGHEIDVTLCDLAASRRAATPTEAAELVFPDRTAVLQQLTSLSKRMKQRVVDQLQSAAQTLDALNERCGRRSAAAFLAEAGQRLDRQCQRLDTAVENSTRQQRALFVKTAAQLNALSPLGVLLRGYAIAQSGQGIITSTTQLPPQTPFVLRVADGCVDCLAQKEHEEDVAE